MNTLWEDFVPLEPGVLPEVPTVVHELPQRARFTDSEIFIIRNTNSRYLTHLFHKYPGKFIPQIPRWALERYAAKHSGQVVLDPFVGSGTTLVEGCLHGSRCYGVDIDPLAQLISKVKTTPIADIHLEAIEAKVSSRVFEIKRGTYRPNIPTLPHWFTEEAIEDLSAIHALIQEEFSHDRDSYDFLLCCFSAIIRRVSKADNQTMKTYVSHTNPKKPESARPLFVKTVITYAEQLRKFAQLVPSGGSAEILTGGDARTIDIVWKENELPAVDLAITSPPYIKTVDYIYNQMAELFWIGDRWDLETQSKQNDFKRKYVGNDRVGSREAKTLRLTGVSEVDTYIRKVFEKSQSLALVMFHYFTDLQTHFSMMRKVLKPGAHYVMVVGDSTLAGIAVPTHMLLISCAQAHGFRAQHRFGYEIRNKYMHFPRSGRGGVVTHDWIIDLKNA